MEKILVSACLLGAKVRYDGKDNHQHHLLLQKWLAERRVITICPEVAGGLSTPRPWSEIVNKRVMTKTGKNVTAEYQRGAQLALDKCNEHEIHFALLKAGSPSCGNVEIYDGSFTGKKITGQGLTAALLTAHGIQVFNEYQIDQLARALEN